MVVVMVDYHMPPSLSAPGCQGAAREKRGRDCARQRIGIPGLRSGDALIHSDPSSGVEARHWLGSPWWRPRLVQLRAQRTSRMPGPARFLARKKRKKERFGFLFRSKRFVVKSGIIGASRWEWRCSEYVCCLRLRLVRFGSNSRVEGLRNAIRKHCLQLHAAPRILDAARAVALDGLSSRRVTEEK
jgi:hypothetical protein